ncbi:MAG: alpha/beta fold hydrolase [Syntrophomonadaceae bacterium]|jgi:pimeloyl-ACP methyl ester carboxylesterase
MNLDYSPGLRITYQAAWVPAPQGTILMIHGSGGDHTKWTGLMQRLPQGFNGLALDLPGHGLSSLPLCASIEEMAEFVRQAIETINPPRPLVLAGHSMGAAVCLQMAIEYGELLDGIVLIGGGSRLRVLPALLKTLQEGSVDPNFFRAGFADDTPEETKEREVANYAQVSTRILYADFNACDHFDVSSRLGQVKVPALIIVGEEDRLAPPKYSHYLHENIAGSILKVIPNTGHFILLEKADQVSQAVRDFCSRFPTSFRGNRD